MCSFWLFIQRRPIEDGPSLRLFFLSVPSFCGAGPFCHVPSLLHATGVTITTHLEHHGCGSTGEVEALEEVRFWVKLVTVALHNHSLGCALHTNSNINYSVVCTKPHKGYPHVNASVTLQQPCTATVLAVLCTQPAISHSTDSHFTQYSLIKVVHNLLALIISRQSFTMHCVTRHNSRA